MKDFLRGHSYFFKYLFSYILILLIPLTVMSYIVFGNIMNLFEREVINRNIQMLTQVRDTFEMKIDEMAILAGRLSRNPKLTPFMVRNTPYSRIEAARELQNYKETNKLIYGLFLFMQREGRIYSPYASFSPEYFLTFYEYEKWHITDLKLDLSTVARPIFIPAQNVSLGENYSKRFITYLYPLPPNALYHYGTAIILIDENMIRKMMASIIEDHGGLVIIMDKDRQIISSSGRDPDIIVNGVLSLDDKKYLTTHVESKGAGWSYFAVTPREKVLKGVFRIRRVTLGVVYFVIIIGALVIFLVMLINYRPLLKLRNNLNNIRRLIGGPSEDSIEQVGDDLTAIGNVVERIALDNKNLRYRAEMQKTIMEERILKMLLKTPLQKGNEYS